MEAARAKRPQCVHRIEDVLLDDRPGDPVEQTNEPIRAWRAVARQQPDVFPDFLLREARVESAKLTLTTLNRGRSATLTDPIQSKRANGVARADDGWSTVVDAGWRPGS